MIKDTFTIHIIVFKLLMIEDIMLYSAFLL